jgi:hypothetical protein
MQSLLKLKTYTLVSAGLLFAIGLYGFAFRGLTSLPDFYLFISLILGFWGLIVVSQRRR